MIHLWKKNRLGAGGAKWEDLGSHLSLFHGLCAVARGQRKGEYWLCDGAGNLLTLRVWRPGDIGMLPDAELLAASAPAEHVIAPPARRGGTVFSLGTMLN